MRFNIDLFKNVGSVLITNDLNPLVMATIPTFSDEAPFQEFLPLGSKESRLREAEKIRQDFVKSTKHLPRPLRNPASKELEQGER